MAKTAQKVVLFLDSAPAERGRAAEAEFNATATNLGLPWQARCVVVGESAPLLEGAAVVILLDPAKRESLTPRAPDLPAIETWTPASGSDWRAAISRDVSGLVARLLGGRVVADPPLSPPATPAKGPKPKAHTVRVGRETAGRRGKGVTTVFDLPLTVDQMKELAATLKQACGTGGTVKDARIEIQGDHRDKIAAELEKLGYKVKRAGG